MILTHALLLDAGWQSNAGRGARRGRSGEIRRRRSQRRHPRPHSDRPRASARNGTASLDQNRLVKILDFFLDSLSPSV
jgi:hypothetical protein